MISIKFSGSGASEGGGYSSESALDSRCYDSLLFGGYHVIDCSLIVTVDLRLVGVGPFEDGQRTVAARFERRGVVVPSLYDFLTAHEVTDRIVGPSEESPQTILTRLPEHPGTPPPRQSKPGPPRTPGGWPRKSSASNANSTGHTSGSRTSRNGFDGTGPSSGSRPLTTASAPSGARGVPTLDETGVTPPR